MSKKLLVLMLIAAFACMSYGATLIGDWESTDDDWIDWSDGVGIDEGHIPPYYYESTIGVTSGSESLGLTAPSGWGQTLSIKLQDAGHIADYMANDKLEIDVSVGPATEGGWNEVYQVSINVEGFAWSDIADTTPAVHYDFWDGSGERTTTLVLDYSAFKPATAPGYAEFIFATNGSGVHDIYFDNARLTPEPATLALLGLGGLLLRRRR